MSDNVVIALIGSVTWLATIAMFVFAPGRKDDEAERGCGHKVLPPAPLPPLRITQKGEKHGNHSKNDGRRI